MYAVIATGGKQYKVNLNEVVEVETLESEVGKNIDFDQVLLIANGEEIKIGDPYIKNAKVVGEVVEHGRGEKINIIKFRRRKHYMRRQGHRQNFTAVKITAIG